MTRRKKTRAELLQDKKAGKPGHLSVALSQEVLNRLDEAAERLTDKSPSTVRRSDIVKLAIREWLEKHQSKK